MFQMFVYEMIDDRTLFTLPIVQEWSIVISATTTSWCGRRQRNSMTGTSMTTSEATSSGTRDNRLRSHDVFVHRLRHRHCNYVPDAVYQPRAGPFGMRRNTLSGVPFEASSLGRRMARSVLLRGRTLRSVPCYRPAHPLAAAAERLHSQQSKSRLAGDLRLLETRCPWYDVYARWRELIQQYNQVPKDQPFDTSVQ